MRENAIKRGHLVTFPRPFIFDVFVATVKTKERERKKNEEGRSNTGSRRKRGKRKARDRFVNPRRIMLAEMQFAS